MDASRLEPRSLRNVAEQLIEELGNEGILWEANREDYITSLVRQWVTYDAHATLFTREGQFYFTIAERSPGRFDVGRRLSPDRWVVSLTEEWKVRREDLLDTLHQLNIAQSAEVVSADGELLRLSVNPQTSMRKVGPVDPKPVPADFKRDYRVVASSAVRKSLGQWLEPADEEALTSSVARQWQDYDGHAVLILPEQRMVFTLQEQGGGNAEVGIAESKLDLTPFLHGLGFEPASVPDIIRELNAGKHIPFRNPAGVPSVLWSDARAGTVFARPLNSPAPAPPARAQPLFCPRCSAVLGRWRAGEERQTCPQCGCEVSSH